MLSGHSVQREGDEEKTRERGRRDNGMGEEEETDVESGTRKGERE